MRVRRNEGAGVLLKRGGLQKQKREEGRGAQERESGRSAGTGEVRGETTLPSSSASHSTGPRTFGAHASSSFAQPELKRVLIPSNDHLSFVSAKIRLVDPYGVNRSDNKLSLRLRVVRVLCDRRQSNSNPSDPP